MNSCIEFGEGLYGVKVFFYKAQGFAQKIHSENYSFPEGLTEDQRKDFMIECKADFHKEVMHKIRFKSNPNYERDNALARATINDRP